MLSQTKHFISPLWLLLVLVIVGAMGFAHTSTVYAQDDDGAKAAPANAPNAQGEKPKQEERFLVWVVKTSGWIGGFLLIISIYFIATVIQLFMELKPAVVAPPELMEECEGLLAKRDFNSIYKLAKDSPSELGQLIATGMVGLSTGLADAREAIDRQGEVVAVDMEKRISMLAVVGTLGPLIGLLGTLKGMIASFSVIATKDTQMKASEVAGGISEALLLTFEGVFLSVPAIFFFAYFKNRVAALTVQTLNASDEFIRRLHAVAHKKTAAAESAS